ncbi:hypothetical protein BJ138DRAFT_1118410 [Hygrophoropsis aurantiaca]|uniref:Uncharacterized protein n=1 Tax=Hygrophoropsis aurantiaca TaxID=72124 RepID=A0ACB7ZX95_9AGAM|nr:hypothetical protein BJ138DRAFT_1118410 [Hygrophoropsis aurantiaca]
MDPDSPISKSPSHSLLKLSTPLPNSGVGWSRNPIFYCHPASPAWNFDSISSSQSIVPRNLDSIGSSQSIVPQNLKISELPNGLSDPPEPLIPFNGTSMPIFSSSSQATSVNNTVRKATQDSTPVYSGSQVHLEIYSAYKALQIEAEATKWEYKVLREAYTKLANAVPRAFSLVSNPLGITDSHISDEQHSLPLEPSSKANFPGVTFKYWTKAKWDTADKEQKEVCTTDKKSASRGNTRASQGINVRLQFVEDQNGMPVDGFRATQMKSLARDIFALFASRDSAPKHWSKADLNIKNAYRAEMYRQFPELRCCENHWKVDKIATDTYSNWRRDNLESIQADNAPSSIKIEKAESTEPCDITAKRSRSLSLSESETELSNATTTKKTKLQAPNPNSGNPRASDASAMASTTSQDMNSDDISNSADVERTFGQSHEEDKTPMNDSDVATTPVEIVDPLFSLFERPSQPQSDSDPKRLDTPALGMNLPRPEIITNTPATTNNTPPHASGLDLPSINRPPAPPRKPAKLRPSKANTARNLCMREYLITHKDATKDEFNEFFKHLDQEALHKYELEALQLKQAAAPTKKKAT